MVKRVLMVAFHFPPQRGSSGLQRTLQFVRNLPVLGWEPLVLSAAPRAYEATGDDQLGAIPSSTCVRRAFALDTARHLAFRGRYLGWMALPDRWISWLLGAVPAGIALVRKRRPAVLWSTYPIATAHLIGLVLHRLTGLPWVADLRDPMVDAVHPSGKLKRATALWIERQTLRHCTRAVCTTAGAMRSYRARYPDLPQDRLCVIENGYDEDNFSGAGTPQPRARGAPLVLLHSGIVYPLERDPACFFEALAALRHEGKIGAHTLHVVLRAPVMETYLRDLITRYGVEDMVELAPALPYREALHEMLAADALLVLQAANCNDQVPAKLYEYLRAARPILALTDVAGDTAATLRAAGVDSIAPLDSTAGIIDALPRFLDQVLAGTAPIASPLVARLHERKAQALQLAQLFDELTGPAQGRATQPAKSAKAP
jgi:glycosyltransferase involved in cell wall biosynthesis